MGECKCHWCGKVIVGKGESNSLFGMFGYFFCCGDCLAQYQNYVENNK